mmetsp:Transcript_26167/g.60823  ORF Transcript_26167/g.60823 Transcript_26167/m.60823 type:complete len:108 (-) Transcript_26167:135-458(-)
MWTTQRGGSAVAHKKQKHLQSRVFQGKKPQPRVGNRHGNFSDHQDDATLRNVVIDFLLFYGLPTCTTQFLDMRLEHMLLRAHEEYSPQTDSPQQPTLPPLAARSLLA